MARCDPNEAIPRTCAEAFQSIRETQAAHGEILKSIHAKATQTNGDVRELFARSSNQQGRLVALEQAAKDARSARATWARRAWDVLKICGAAGLAAWLTT